MDQHEQTPTSDILGHILELIFAFIRIFIFAFMNSATKEEGMILM